MAGEAVCGPVTAAVDTAADQSDIAACGVGQMCEGCCEVVTVSHTSRQHLISVVHIPAVVVAVVSLGHVAEIAVAYHIIIAGLDLIRTAHGVVGDLA